ncbi:MAG: hypothetical protein Unbinned8622contig1005_25 [Prokaryotic dsDNA virus sp.]|nr:MAG: hypothetical protein Unbinned8622contig1005_25 [Prokaryotic dsDNA virus sp.]|tara:strand:+ start:16013 stop:16213 length:201 start_codon:yes stop_codon:yes gene_type:complete
MAIELVKYNYGDADTSVAVSYTDDGVESTVTVSTIMSNGVVDFNATETAILTAVYGEESPPAIIPE